MKVDGVMKVGSGIAKNFLFIFFIFLGRKGDGEGGKSVFSKVSK